MTTEQRVCDVVAVQNSRLWIEKVELDSGGKKSSVFFGLSSNGHRAFKFGAMFG